MVWFFKIKWRFVETRRRRSAFHLIVMNATSGAYWQSIRSCYRDDANGHVDTLQTDTLANVRGVQHSRQPVHGLDCKKPCVFVTLRCLSECINLGGTTSRLCNIDTSWTLKWIVMVETPTTTGQPPQCSAEAEMIRFIKINGKWGRLVAS